MSSVYPASAPRVSWSESCNSERRGAGGNDRDRQRRPSLQLRGGMNMIHQRRLLFLAVLAAALSFTACGGNTSNAPVSAQEQTVQVQVTDDHIKMPTELPAGMATFEVTNAGT